MAIDVTKRKSDNWLAMNWKLLIKDLVESGMTQTQIAAACKTGQSHISSLLKGKRKRPNWELGEAIRALHEQRTRPSGHFAASGKMVPNTGDGAGG